MRSPEERFGDLVVTVLEIYQEGGIESIGSISAKEWTFDYILKEYKNFKKHIDSLKEK